MSIVIAGIHLGMNKHARIALRQITGIGNSTAVEICKNANVAEDAKIKDLTADQEEKLREEVAKYPTEGELRSKVATDIKQKMDIGAYQGRRHRHKKPVRGQRTKTNAKTARRKRVMK